MLALCDETGDGPIYELGSGWGNMVVALAKRYPQRSIVAYEASLLPWLVSVVWVKALGLQNVQVRRQNFLHADLSDAQVMVCYLFPKGMVKLQAKLADKAGSLNYLISHHFALPHHEPIQILRLKDAYKTPIYLYKVHV